MIDTLFTMGTEDYRIFVEILESLRRGNPEHDGFRACFPVAGMYADVVISFRKEDE